MEQPHGHPAGDAAQLFQVGIGLSLLIFFVELFGGFWTHSLALMSDAWHIFIDIWALIISFLAVIVARRPVNDRRTFGLHRMEVFAAAINGLSVFVIAIGILAAAWRRYQNPGVIHAGKLIALAGVSLALNLVVAALFYKQSHRDLNVRGAFLHVIGDVLNTVAVLAAGLLTLATGSPKIDPLVSALIALVVLWGSGRLLQEAVNTLLEGVPKGIEVQSVESEIRAVAGVASVHDLHVWSICSHLNALSGHVLLEPQEMPNQHTVLEKIGASLKRRFGIVHTTIQVESKAWPRLEEP